MTIASDLAILCDLINYSPSFSEYEKNTRRLEESMVKLSSLSSAIGPLMDLIIEHFGQLFDTKKHDVRSVKNWIIVFHNLCQDDKNPDLFHSSRCCTLWEYFPPLLDAFLDNLSDHSLKDAFLEGIDLLSFFSCDFLHGALLYDRIQPHLDELIKLYFDHKCRKGVRYWARLVAMFATIPSLSSQMTKYSSVVRKCWLYSGTSLDYARYLCNSVWISWKGKRIRVPFDSLLDNIRCVVLRRDRGLKLGKIEYKKHSEQLIEEVCYYSKFSRRERNKCRCTIIIAWKCVCELVELSAAFIPLSDIVRIFTGYTSIKDTLGRWNYEHFFKLSTIFAQKLRETKIDVFAQPFFSWFERLVFPECIDFLKKKAQIKSSANILHSLLSTLVEVSTLPVDIHQAMFDMFIQHFMAIFSQMRDIESDGESFASILRITTNIVSSFSAKEKQSEKHAALLLESVPLFLRSCNMLETSINDSSILFSNSVMVHVLDFFNIFIDTPPLSHSSFFTSLIFLRIEHILFEWISLMKRHDIAAYHVSPDLLASIALKWTNIMVSASKCEQIHPLFFQDKLLDAFEWCCGHNKTLDLTQRTSKFTHVKFMAKKHDTMKIDAFSLKSLDDDMDVLSVCSIFISSRNTLFSMFEPEMMMCSGSTPSTLAVDSKLSIHQASKYLCVVLSSWYRHSFENETKILSKSEQLLSLAALNTTFEQWFGLVGMNVEEKLLSPSRDILDDILELGYQFIRGNERVSKRKLRFSTTYQHLLDFVTRYISSHLCIPLSDSSDGTGRSAHCSPRELDFLADRVETVMDILEAISRFSFSEIQEQVFHDVKVLFDVCIATDWYKGRGKEFIGKWFKTLAQVTWDHQLNDVAVPVCKRFIQILPRISRVFPQYCPDRPKDLKFLSDDIGCVLRFMLNLCCDVAYYKPIYSTIKRHVGGWFEAIKATKDTRGRFDRRNIRSISQLLATLSECSANSVLLQEHTLSMQWCNRNGAEVEDLKVFLDNCVSILSTIEEALSNDM
ncbi:hypothetical protein ADUPG1_008822, partial [Aduncisulcus paluster]